jgi:hypothetical protein
MSIETALAKAFSEMVADMARKTIEVLRAMSVEEVLAISGLERRTITRPAKKANPAQARVPTQTTAKLVVGLLRKSDGLSAEAIRKELGLPRGPWRNAIGALVSSGQVRQQGTKRSARYFVGGKTGGQNAKKPGTSSRKRPGRTKVK